MGATKKNAFDEYMRSLIRSKARQLVGRFGFTSADREDIEQELALHLMERMAQFDPRRSSGSTFIDRISQHKIASMLRGRYAQRRDYRRSVSLDDDGTHQTIEPVTRCQPRANPDLAIDMAHALESLDAELRKVCKLLEHVSIAETARRLGLSRTQARSRIAKIRMLLTGRGLDEYAGPENSRFRIRSRK